MKILLFTSFLFLLISTCRKRDIAIFDTDIDVYQQEALCFGRDKDLSLEVKEINDSRCPEGVTCIWEGNASVIVEVKSAKIPVAEVNLCLGACTAIGAIAEEILKIDGASYKIHLQQIKKGKRDALKAVLRISKL